jgi:hypothetical protein
MPVLTNVTRLGAMTVVALGMAACVAAPPPPPPAPMAVEQPPPPPPRPPNTGVPRPMPGIALFSAPNFRGEPTMLDHAIPDLASSGMSGPILSVEVTGRPWQLCTRPGFGGHCITVRHSVHNLAKLGLAGRIASLRRVK